MSFTSYTPTEGLVIEEAVLTSDFATASTSFVNVTGLGFSCEAGSTYLVEFFLSFQSGATSNGIGIGTNLPGGCIVDLTMREMQSSTDTSLIFESGDGNGDTTPTISTAVAATGTSYFARVTCIVKTSIFTGSVQLRVRSETASGITLQQGSYGRMRKTA